MPRSIVSVSTVRSFVEELRDYGIRSILIAMDSGFYSSKNIKQLKDHSIIGAISSNLKIHRDLISRSHDIENSRNYIQYGSDTVFHMDYSINGLRYIVYYSAKARAEKIRTFYSRLSDIEIDLKDLKEKKFDNEDDMIRTVTTTASDMARYIEIEYPGNTFEYKLKHSAIKEKTDRMGYFVLFTNTMMNASDILKI